jgi:polysaccharide pyruvyl transferase WcaK-like protein
LAQAETKIGLLHHVGGGNLGDDATLAAVAENIQRRWPNAEITALSMNPDDTKIRHKIMSHPIQRKRWSIGYKPPGRERIIKGIVKALARKYRIFNLLKSINAMICVPNEVFSEILFLASSRRFVKSFDVLIISGGGQLTEKDGSWAFPYTIFKWIFLARSARVRCMFLNVGAGPLTYPLSKFFVTRALMAADYVSLRDGNSRALIHEIGFNGESRVYPDCVYGLEVSTRNGGPPETRAQPIVGFAPMPYPDGRESTAEMAQYNEFICKLANFASWLVSDSYQITMFGTDFGVDPLAIEDLKIALLSRYNVTSSKYAVNDSGVSVHALLTAMSGMDYVVTCRFHGVVFAHLLNKPVLAIAHHPKVRDLMEDLELSSYCVDIRKFDLRLLMDRFSSLVINAEEIKRRMEARLTINKARLRSQFDELFPY